MTAACPPTQSDGVALSFISVATYRHPCSQAFSPDKARVTHHQLEPPPPSDERRYLEHTAILSLAVLYTVSQTNTGIEFTHHYISIGCLGLCESSFYGSSTLLSLVSSTRVLD